MSTIQTALQLYDGMSPALRHMQNALNIVISHFETLENTSSHAIDTAVIRDARSELARASTTFTDIEESIRRSSEQQENFNSQVKAGAESAKGLENALNKAKGALGAIGVAVGVGAILKSGDNQNSAVNLYQSQTGANDMQAEQMRRAMKSLYVSNIGEDFNDIANSMSLITQVTGQTGRALETTTRNALLLRDTFEFDVAESIRAVDMMQRQFGLNSSQAYDMIVQGAQAGLNKNDDLLDTINEYSSYFNKLGFEANDMFNMLINGAKEGTFSVDKLGDAIKEFSIRAIDGSNTTKEGFATLGMDANKMAQQFAKGGEAAKKAFEKTMNALANVRDPVERNIAGTNLLGTMWEDLGEKGVMALSEINGAVSVTTRHLEELQQTRYDDATSALAALGRTINVALGDAVTDAVQSAAAGIQDFTAGVQGETEQIEGIFGRIGLAARDVGMAIQENWYWIAPVILGVVTALGIYKSTMLAINIIEGISNLIKGVSIATTMLKRGSTLSEVAATELATGAQIGYNAALLACPLTWIVLAIIAVIVVIGIWINKMGGIKIAWMVVHNFLLTSWGNLKVAAYRFAYGCLNIFDNLQYGWKAVGVGIANLVGNAKVTVLEQLQDMTNGAIDIINDLIAKVNKIPGVNIDAVEHVTFGTNAKVAEEAARQARESDLAAAKAQKDANRKERDAQISAMEKANKVDAAKRQKAIDEARKAADKESKLDNTKQYDKLLSQVQAGTGASKIGEGAATKSIDLNTDKTAKNTKKAADKLTASSTDLKYLREIASQKSINRYTTAEIKVSMTNHNTVNSDMDLDGISEHLRTKVEEQMIEAAAKGVH